VNASANVVANLMTEEYARLVPCASTFVRSENANQNGGADRRITTSERFVPGADATAAGAHDDLLPDQ
jgi:hypothetical protein